MYGTCRDSAWCVRTLSRCACSLCPAAQVLSLFGSGREEDKMVGYLSFLKIGPKLLKFLPGGCKAGAGAGGIRRRAGNMRCCVATAGGALLNLKAPRSSQ